MSRKVLIVATMLAVSTVIVLQSCEKFEPSQPNADEVIDAPVEGLSAAQNKVFLDGAAEFDEVYNTTTGLGPLFVVNSCGGCHAGDNRGHLFTNLTRFGQTDSTGNKFLEFGAPQLQNKSLFGYKAEELPAGATSSNFIAPIVSGVGFLELVTDADILDMADPNDANNDGISGVPNWIGLPDWVIPAANAIHRNGKYIGRFGRKASAYNVHQQTVGAFNQDMGMTTSFMPENPFNYKEGIPQAIGEPDITDAKLNAVVFYLQTLQAPIQRNQNDPTVLYGKKLFTQIGCESCHKQKLRTGYSVIEPLSNKEFSPYTDLLLHDMGSELDDNYTEGNAKTSEWRTSPLWGLGLAPGSQGGQFFLMHDGRAKGIEEAIKLHGGESANSRTKFNSLTEADKEAVIKFLKSL